MTAPRLLVDIVADPVCPWCYVGVRSFAAAKEELTATFDVVARFRPYQLNPDTPEEGADREAYLRAKFDSDRLAAIREKLKDAARATGFAFDAGRPKRLPNTLKAHQALRWAHFDGLHEAFALAIYKAYWDDGADIGDIETLAAIAASAGMDAEVVEKKLLAGVDRKAVSAEADDMREAGVAGVPTFIVDERTGFSGALPPRELAAALRHAHGAQLATLLHKQSEAG